MNKKQIRYCMLVLINDDNHSKIYISKENKYYIRSDGSVRLKIFNEFEDIRKSYRKINIIDESDNYHCKSDGSDDIKHCTILLIDDDNYSNIFTSGKNVYSIKHFDYFDSDDDSDDYDSDDDYNEIFYNKPFNDFKRLVSVKHNYIVNLINKDNHKHNITLLVNDSNIRIYET